MWRGGYRTGHGRANFNRVRAQHNNDMLTEEPGGNDEFGDRAGGRKRAMCGGGGRLRRPSCLRGKEIGLWYASQQKLANQKAEEQRRPVVSIDKQDQRHLERLLHHVEKSHPNEGGNCSSEKRTTVNADNKFASWDGDGTGLTFDDSAAFGDEYLGFSLLENLSDTEEIFDTLLDDQLVLEAGKAELKQSGEVELSSNSAFDEELYAAYQSMINGSEYQRMQPNRRKLPAYEMSAEIVKLVEQHQVCVISGETGSGKTTQVPQMLLDAALSAGRGSPRI